MLPRRHPLPLDLAPCLARCVACGTVVCAQVASGRSLVLYDKPCWSGTTKATVGACTRVQRVTNMPPELNSCGCAALGAEGVAVLVRLLAPGRRCQSTAAHATRPHAPHPQRAHCLLGARHHRRRRRRLGGRGARLHGDRPAHPRLPGSKLPGQRQVVLWGWASRAFANWCTCLSTLITTRCWRHVNGPRRLPIGFAGWGPLPIVLHIGSPLTPLARHGHGKPRWKTHSP